MLTDRRWGVAFLEDYGMLGRFDLCRGGDALPWLGDCLCGGGFGIGGCNLTNLTMREADLSLKTHFDGDELGRAGSLCRQRGRRVLWECSIVELTFVDQSRIVGRILTEIPHQCRYFPHPRHLVGFFRGGQFSR
jgi:hypothetical protein